MVCLLSGKKTPQQKMRRFWLLLIFLFFGIFLFLKIVPFGHISYRKDFTRILQSGKGFIYNFTPVERVSDENNRPRLIGDPVYFSVFTPRTFTKAKLTLSYYSNLTDQTPIIEAGVLVDKQVWRYDLQPLKNQILDDLKNTWFKIEQDNLVLLQKNKNYESLDQFLIALENNDLKDCSSGVTTCLATYNFNPNYQFKSTKSKATATNLDIALRGNHVLWLYLNDGAWQFKTNFSAYSPETKNSPLKLILTKDQEVIKEVIIEGEKVDWQNQKSQTLNLEGNFSAGLYKLEIKISDDVIIDNIYSSSGLMVFTHKFWPVSASDEIKVFTEANYLQVKALDPANLQDIYFGEQSFTVSAPYEQFEYVVSGNDLKEIKFAKADLILENNGVFSLSAEDYFNPLLKKVDRHFVLADDLEYVIFDYQTPSLDVKDRQLNIASAEFRTKGTYREKGKYSFMLSIPGLKTENGEDDYLEIKEIKIEFTGRSLWQKIFKIDD
ncbi:MAG: hypothetical protein ACOX0H_03155 [Patescibacteria group bacterium]|jgi:hypothetical protein|nr:hypothetical protein [bacterium]HQC49865.1 hypothetical protein [bacterium]